MQWMLSQLEVDYLNYRIELNAVTSEPPTNLVELRRRYDIFYSRVAIIKEGSAFKNLYGDKSSWQLIDKIWRYLERNTALIDADDATLRAEINALIERTAALGDDIRMLSLKGIDLHALASDQQRKNVSQTLIQIASLSLVLFTMLVVVFWLLSQQFKLMKSHSSATQLVSSRLNAVVTSSLDAVIVIDRDAKVLEFNAAAQDIFGYSKHEAVGGDLAEMIVPDALRQAHRQGMQQYLKTGQKRVVGKGRIRLDAKRKSGDVFPVELSISSAKSKDGEIFVAFLRDISNRVAEEEELKQARDDALAGEKAKAELLAVMSHEMRTPLNGMLGTLELMEDTHLSDRQAQYLDIINASGKMLLHHVNDVLDISRLSSGRLDAANGLFDLCKLINEICDSQRPIAFSRSNRIETDLSSLEGKVVKGNELHLRQVLLNIIGNAVKFTKNGVITVQAQAKPNSWIEFRVIDDGIGIENADISRIFDDFVTLDSSYAREQAGTGLGLGITKRMVKAMGGELGVESQINEGSLFWVRLPLPEYRGTLRKTETDFETKAPHHDPVPLTSKQILVIEDNEINRLVVREMLEKDGHIVTETNDGDDGVAISQAKAFDLILMDISMPRLDGVEATKLIRNSHGPSARTPIIALTAHALPDEIKQFNAVGMNGTLIKPISRKALNEIIVSATDQKGETDGQKDAATPSHVIDAAVLLELTQSLGEAKADQLIAKFCSQADHELQWIVANAAKDDVRTEFIKRVHKLAGSASMFGVQQLRASLHRIEAKCKADRLCDLSHEINDLLDLWGASQTSLRAHLKELS